jgi:hypothetical protein
MSTGTDSDIRTALPIFDPDMHYWIVWVVKAMLNLSIILFFQKKELDHNAQLLIVYFMRCISVTSQDT